MKIHKTCIQSLAYMNNELLCIYMENNLQTDSYGTLLRQSTFDYLLPFKELHSITKNVYDTI